jgi:hypothetical protein
MRRRAFSKLKGKLNFASEVPAPSSINARTTGEHPRLLHNQISAYEY